MKRIVKAIVQQSLLDIKTKGEWLFFAEHRDLKLEVSTGFGPFRDNLASQEFADEVITESLKEIVRAYDKEAQIRKSIKQLNKQIKSK
mgnify:CR=1 FL=1